MRAGRPKQHVKAKWVTWRDDTTGKREFFELNANGTLINRTITPHHIQILHSTQQIPIQSPLTITVSEMTCSFKDDKDRSILETTNEELFIWDDQSAVLDWQTDFPFG
jgi:hypothetical protein